MDSFMELKERREAIAHAQSEFYRVKQEKMEKEAKKARNTNPKEEKQLQRERTNRASAAASRAKIICYAKELEKRTDRLERERNFQEARTQKTIKKLKQYKDVNKKLKGILKSLWELKDPKACSFLIESESLFLIGPTADQEDSSDDENVSATFQKLSSPLEKNSSLSLPHGNTNYQTHNLLSHSTVNVPSPMRPHSYIQPIYTHRVEHLSGDNRVPAPEKPVPRQRYRTELIYQSSPTTYSVRSILSKQKASLVSLVHSGNVQVQTQSENSVAIRAAHGTDETERKFVVRDHEGSEQQYFMLPTRKRPTYQHLNNS